MTGPAHYVRRFATSLSRRPPAEVDERWARSRLTPGEWSLLERLPAPDRRHLIANGRAVAAAFGPGADPRWVRAALLHDVGKYHARLGTVGRSVATVVAVGLGRARVAGWVDRRGWRGRIGRYERHGEIGAAEIRAAGGPEIAAEWSAIHHRPERFAGSTIPPAVLAVLDATDR